MMQDNRLYYYEAEASVVGAILLENDLMNDCTLEPHMIFSSDMRIIFNAMKQLHEKGIPIDFITIHEQLGPDNLEMVGGMSFIVGLKNSVPTTANFAFYQNLVKKYYQKRKTIEISERLIDKVYDDDLSETVQEGIQHLMEIGDNMDDADTGEIKDYLVEMYSDCENDRGEITGIESSFSDLDRLTGGFQDSDFIVIGARPSVGKTALALNIGFDAAKKHRTLIFSLEMGTKQLLTRMACFLGGIDSQKIKSPKLFFEKEDWSNYSRAVGKIAEANLHIFDRSFMDLNYIWSKVRKVRRNNQEEKMIVIIDYLQLIVGNPKLAHNRQAQISEISRGLKHMARELNVVVLALSQLSRAVEMREDKRPILSDLRESGQIEQDADLIAFLYRDDYYHQRSAEKNIMEVILAKHRNGPIGTVKLGFRSEVGRFFDLRETSSRGISSNVKGK